MKNIISCACVSISIVNARGALDSTLFLHCNARLLLM
jgi:hypothetical protein